MTEQEKMSRLEQVLKENGLSFDQEDVYDFFYAKRGQRSNLSSDGKIYSYSNLIKPELETVTPLDFENNGYKDNGEGRLIDWYLYKFFDEERDKLVPENIGKDSTSILDSFKNDKKTKKQAFRNHDGELFLGEDGNHRLLTLVINQFLERINAKTKEQKLSIDEKYKFQIPVRTEVSRNLYSLLNEKYEEMINAVPQMVLEYRQNMFTEQGESDYICKRDSKNKTFTYKPDEVDFVGDEDELINFLETNKSKQQSIMRWNCNGIYYASFYNKVIKSKNKSVVDKYFDVLKKSYNNDELGYNPFLEIKDLDSNTYEIQTPLVVIKGQGLKNAIAKYQESLLRSGNEQVFLNKLENGQDVFKKYKEEIESVKKQAPWPMMILPRKYVGLSKGEYNQLVLLVKKEKGILGVKEINPEEPDL